MKSQQIADKIMRGILDPDNCSEEEGQIAVRFVELVAHTLCRGWKDFSKLDQACSGLMQGFANGRLALKAEPHTLTILQSDTGEFRVRIPLDELTR